MQSAPDFALPSPSSACSPPEPASAGRWTVACLCAAWCRTCEAWQPAFDAHAAAHPSVQFRWVDIEDAADDIGDLDVETFPTLLVAHEGRPLFFGPVLPRTGAIDALLASLSGGPLRAIPDADRLAELLAHLAA